ncbi:MAG TPA: glycosyltransferase family 1 protein [Gemmatimonadaceae bacterium]|nr:glycosyltransferase family 1 protein [Gemmatimonadaceae bacterium]
MKIALNLLYLIPGVVGGTETYARALITALGRLDEDHEYTVYVNRESADLDITPNESFTRVVCPVVAMQRAYRYSWEQLVLPAQLHRLNPDLVHSLGYVGPLASRKPQVVSVHDVNYLGHSGRRTPVGRRAFQFFVEKTVERASHVITISNFSRGEIMKHLGVPPEKVSVVYCAAREQASIGLSSPQQESEVVRNLSQPFMIAFSSLSAHKNIARLIAAFARISSDVPHSLVLIGHMPEKSAEIKAALQRAGDDRIHFTGFIPDSDVDALMKRTSLFVFPSLYEGFGLPILDAQEADVPIACSNVAALPEVAGEGAILFDPLSVDDMAEKLKRALLDTALRESLVVSGRENAARFSWNKAASETMSIYRKVVA